jgi:hypothetical protein
MIDKSSGMTEANVTIEGTVLTFAQSMALRVALSDFLMQLDDGEFTNGLGPELAQNYRDRCSEVLKLMLGNRRK